MCVPVVYFAIPRSFRRVLTLVCALCPTALAGPQAQPSPPIVLITIDTLRADRLAPYGDPKAETPAIGALAEDGVLFERAIVQTPITLPSHASILTASYPMFHGLQDVVGRLADDVPTVTEWIKERGYRTAAFVGSSVLSADWGLNRGFEVYDDAMMPVPGSGRVDIDRQERPAEQVVSRAMGWIEAHRGEPFFVWIHLYDPHDPYAPPEPFASRFKERPYAGEIAYVDSQLGRLFDRLRSLGLYEDSLIVFTADHGESLGEHGEKYHAFFIYEASLRVPLIFKAPRSRVGSNKLKGLRVPNQVRSVDIVPTVAQILGAPVPRWVQGEGLLAMILGRRPGLDLPAYAETHYPRVHFGWSPLFSLSRGDKKFIDAPKPEFYDLSDDPGEANNRFAENQALANRLKEEIRGLQKRYARRGGQEAPVEVDAETIARLQSLGYVAFSQGGTSTVDWEGLPDPKDKIGTYNILNQAIDYSRADRVDDSLRLLASVAEREPEMPLVHFLAGTEYAKAGLHLKAVEEFKSTIRYNPQSDVARFNLAQSSLAAGLGPEGERVLEELIKSNPRHYAARELLARRFANSGRPADAVDQLREVVRLRPDRVDAHNNLGAYLFQMDEVDEAAEEYRRTLELAPDHLQARINLALALIRLGRYQEASEQAAVAVRLRPETALAHFYLGQALLGQGLKDEAQTEFEEAKRLDPNLRIPSF